ncbi:PQQ-binding-like beta-propeller repeat protein [Actinoplanes subtropicus]|uniref:outer membrane protein assembly factor BamB family protein n=1 Tax=Actinoplanes subtropicus TaxID=543632 RepID=UPI0004C4419D|nr:PQQ-binding-like beta-propeller repeat protein [Actinoplanes subtropicus]
MSTIELGEISSAPVAEPSAEFDRRLVREIVIALVLLLCLIGAAGSARPAPPGVRPLWSVPISDSDGITLGPETLYVYRGASLTAYNLASGTMRWRTTVENTLGYAQLAGGLLLLPADQQTGHRGNVFTQFSRRTVAIAAATGAQVWSAPGEPAIVTGDTALMADHTDSAAYARLRLIRLADRSTLWQRETPGVTSVSFALTGDSPGQVVLVTDEGQATVLRLADGAVVARARIDWAGPLPDREQFNDVVVSGDHLVVNRNAQDRAELSVYRLATLERLWRTDGTDGFAFPCGSGLCFSNGQSLTSYDADTGRIRWRVPGAGSAWSATIDRVVFEEANEPGGQFLIDAETGTRVGTPGPGESVWTTEPEEALLVLQPTRSAPQRTAITRWDLTTGRRDLLGAIDRIVVNRCQAVARYLGCYEDGAYTVTAVG